MQPSVRGELEITSVNQIYLERGSLNIELLGRGFAWLDTGTAESLLEAGLFVHTLEKRQGFKVACLEEIALANGWIPARKILAKIASHQNTDYGSYLREIALAHVED